MAVAISCVRFFDFWSADKPRDYENENGTRNWLEMLRKLGLKSVFVDSLCADCTESKLWLRFDDANLFESIGIDFPSLKS